jgi:hypothetical protein
VQLLTADTQTTHIFIWMLRDFWQIYTEHITERCTGRPSCFTHGNRTAQPGRLYLVLTAGSEKNAVVLCKQNGLSPSTHESKSYCTVLTTVSLHKRKSSESLLHNCYNVLVALVSQSEIYHGCRAIV